MTRFPLLETEIGIPEFMERFVAPETFLHACRACPNYGRIWSCPPYGFEVTEYWQRYSRLRLLVLKVPVAALKSEEVGPRLAEARNALDGMLQTLEARHPGSMALQSGCCLLCSTCARSCGEDCRHPDRLRYSIESLGGDVTAALKELLEVELQWYSPEQVPDYLVQAGGLLLP